RAPRGGVATHGIGNSVRRGGESHVGGAAPRTNRERLHARRTHSRECVILTISRRYHTLSTTTVPSDIEIAQRVRMRPIEDVAAELGLDRDDLDLYGKYKAKIPLEISQRPARGRLVVVTATNPTPAGEGMS